jgi:hypothetical protein
MPRFPISALALLVGATSLSGVVGAQDTPTFARLQPDNAVELLDLQAGTWRRIFRSPAWGLTGLSIAPSGSRLALLSWTEGVVSGHDYTVPPAPELVVIDTTGQVLASVSKVQRYDWCGASCIVYITGEYDETDIGFRPADIGMLDVVTGDTRSLPAPPYPIGVTWGAFDSTAYVKNAPRKGEARIYRIDPRTRALSPTELKDHLFSPTGRYYLHGPLLADSLVLYETSSNSPIDLSKLRREAKLLGWASSNDDVLLTLRMDRSKAAMPGHRTAPKPRKPGDGPEETYELYRVSDGRTLGRVKGYLREWSGPDHRRLVQQGGNYRVLDGR